VVCESGNRDCQEGETSIEADRTFREERMKENEDLGQKIKFVNM